MLLNERLSQVVPTLTPRQIQFALRFASGPARRFAPMKSCWTWATEIPTSG